MSEVLLNRDYYAKLIDDDIAWLKEHTEPGFIQHHIIEVLKDSINMYYPQRLPSKIGHPIKIVKNTNNFVI